MRSYDVAVASLAIQAPPKWTDNLLTQHPIPHVITARRGIPRRITYSALVRIALIRQIHVSLGVSVADGVRIAAQILESGSLGVYSSGQITLTVDLKSLERELDERLAAILESAPMPRRGRPPRSTRT